jgi:hypothetical protein
LSIYGVLEGIIKPWDGLNQQYIEELSVCEDV